MKCVVCGRDFPERMMWRSSCQEKDFYYCDPCMRQIDVNDVIELHE